MTKKPSKLEIIRLIIKLESAGGRAVSLSERLILALTPQKTLEKALVSYIDHEKTK